MAEGGSGLDADAVISARICCVAASPSLEGSDEGGREERVSLVTAVTLACCAVHRARTDIAYWVVP
jgi:hypothetical protein